jgi:hypothetical protein
MRHVNLDVHQPSRIELHVQETVRIDRLTPTPDGYVAEQHGALLAPRVTPVQLEKGRYYLRTLNDAQLRVLAGGVQVTRLRAGPKLPPLQGHGPCGRVPTLRVVDATAVVP